MSSMEPKDDDDITISVSVSLDDDGFLRRACPNCSREFKWRPSDNSEPAPDGGYHCPYCNRQAETSSWHTQAQADYFAAVALTEVGGPLLDDLDDSIDRLNRAGGMISARLERDFPTLEQPDEPNEMRRVDLNVIPWSR